MWNGAYWDRKSLFSLSTTFSFTPNHGGKTCPAPISTAKQLTVISLSGIQQIRVDYCGCPASGTASFPYLQLLRAKLFPASFKSPQTAVTFDCLELFHMLTVQGKLTGYDFYTSLEHMTDNSGVDPPSVSKSVTSCLCLFIYGSG